MMTTVTESFGEEDTAAYAKRLSENAKKGEVYALIGDLGVGKTAFAKGFAAGLGITEPVVSPTFTFVQEYTEGRLPLYHFDVYRIGDISEMDEIGYEDCFYGDGVSLVEWADLVEPILPDDVILVTITKDSSKGSDYRKITLESHNDEDNSH